MKGLILFEVLVSIAILCVIIAGIYAVLNVGNMTYSIDINILDLQQNARQAMDWMTREVRESSPGNINIGAGDDQITFNTLNESNICYYLDASNNQIIRRYPPETTRILANNIESLNFYLIGSILEIHVLARRMQRVDSTFFLKEQVRLRNE